jgi:hypothetical protein
MDNFATNSDGKTIYFNPIKLLEGNYQMIFTYKIDDEYELVEKIYFSESLKKCNTNNIIQIISKKENISLIDIENNMLNVKYNLIRKHITKINNILKIFFNLPDNTINYLVDSNDVIDEFVNTMVNQFSKLIINPNIIIDDTLKFYLENHIIRNKFYLN